MMGSVHFSCAQPLAHLMAGKENKWKQTKADTGFPGKPKKYLSSLEANVIGFLRTVNT